MIILNRSFLLSYKGITTVISLIVLYYLIKDYSKWRESKKSKKDIVNTDTVDENKIKNDSSNTPENKDKLSMAHYILVSPFAATYIVGRAIVDSIKYTIYYALWYSEQIIPHLDDWLFNTVTVWLPAKYNQTEHWWTNTGYPLFKKSLTHFTQHIIPLIIQYMETFFMTLYSVCCTVQSTTARFIAFCRDFTQRPEWYALGHRLYEIAYLVIWSPSTWIVTRSIQLGRLIYSGCYASFLSLKEDVHWLIDDIIPRIYGYIASTRIVRVIQFMLSLIYKTVSIVSHVVKDYLLVPVIGNILTWTVRAVDQLIMITQTHGHFVSDGVHIIYSFLGPHIVWMFMDFSLLIMDVIKSINIIFAELLIPAYRLFVKHLLPKLSVLYLGLRTRFISLYSAYISPTWQMIYPYGNKIWQWLYVKMSIPIEVVSQFMYNIVINIRSRMLVLVQSMASIAVDQLKLSLIHAQTFYTWASIWLQKQAPLLSDLLYKIWMVFASYDWTSIIEEGRMVIATIEEWTSTQANIMYASLERSLTLWAVEQGSEELKGDQLKVKPV
ncbi:hypothetical protein BDB01DRAFT_778976 [Pilobolus umbonatus]|nr:hypothetical protein BDB01DRAFT_778976 [Pilobolus umbonatus]